MSEAYVCDRCDDTISGKPPLQVAAPGIETPAGTIKTKVSTSDRPQPISTQLSTGPTAEYSVEKGDLCEDCAEAFREFWDVDGES